MFCFQELWDLRQLEGLWLMEGQEELNLGIGKGERGHPGWLEVSWEATDCLRSY